MGKFGPKNQNCQFKLKFKTKTNSNMQNPMVVFNFLFAQIWSRISKLSVEAVIWYLD